MEEQGVGEIDKLGVNCSSMEDIIQSGKLG